MVSNNLKYILIIMSAAIIVSLGSFFLPNYIAYIIDEGRANGTELNYGKKLRLPAYYRYQKRSSHVGNSDWLIASEFLSKETPSVSVELAEYYWSVNKLDKAEFWFVQAINKNVTSANYRLAELYVEQKLHSKAYQLLFKTDISITKETPKKAVLLALELAIWAGDKSNYKYLSQLFENTEPIIAELNEFGVLSAGAKESTDMDCKNTIDFFATNLPNLRHVAKLKEQIQEHKLSKFICISTIRYIPLRELECNHAKDRKIECNEAIWQKYVKDIRSRYIGVVVPEGGANVHKGILYMDSGDTVDVLAHELAHLLGFIDEYPLPENHAKCLEEQQFALSHNIAVLRPNKKGDRANIRAHVIEQLSWGHMIKPQTPIMTKTESGWRLGTPVKYAQEVGLFPSQTCEGSRALRIGEAVVAFKPVSELTQLNYFELEFPNVYLKVLSKQPGQFLMPSFLVNIADAIN